MADKEKIKQPFIVGAPKEKPPMPTESPGQEYGEFGVEIEPATAENETLKIETPKEPTKIILPGFKKIPAIPAYKDETTIKIEKIMQENLDDVYQTLPPIVKQELKLQGEATAAKIRALLKSTHIKAKKIFELIVAWLKILPGINRFFLEQEAKIKTDKMIRLKKE